MAVARRRAAVTLVLAATLASLALVHSQTPTPTPAPAPPRFEIERVADGVYAAIRTEPAGLILDANSVFIVNDSDVVVVDTNVTPSSARASLAALRTITTKPVTAIVNTHWHDDHIIGNQVYREAFPGVQIIGHASTAADLPVVGAANRQLVLDREPLMAQQLRLSVEQQKSMGGGLLTEEERASYLSDADAVERYASEAPSFQIVLPTTTVTDQLVLTKGSRTIEIRFLGRGHTAADLVVVLPAEKVVITGDLVVLPVPLLGTSSHPQEFAETLGRLVGLKPAIMIPGHGRVLRDDSYVQREIRLMAAIKQQVEQALARGDTADEARKNVSLGALRREFAGDSQLRGFLFDNHVVAAGIGAAYRDATRR